MKILLKSFLIIILISLFQSATAQTNSSNDIRFLSMSDFHFDPFMNCAKESVPCAIVTELKKAPVTQWRILLQKYNSNPPRYRHDSDFALIHSALNSAKATAAQQQAKFVIILGDFLGHDYRRDYRRYSLDRSLSGYQAFVRKTYAFLIAEIKAALPNTDVYALVGNNDSYHWDYYTNPTSTFFYENANLWSSLIVNNNNRAQMRQQFARAGFYAVTVAPNLRLIMLNTVLFSNKAKGVEIRQAAQSQLNWLHQELSKAKAQQQKVLIAMHIPPGVDVYATLRVKLFTLINLWDVSYTRRFKDELAQFAPQIAGLFAGHLHSDWFQILTFNNHTLEIPVNGVPAISPIFGNNPAYKAYIYSQQSLQLKDFITYYLPLNKSAQWQIEYDFNHIYQPNCKDCPILNGMHAVQKTGSLAESFKKYYAVNTQSQPITTKWYPYYWCNVHVPDGSKYKQCVSEN